jgi:hypothetical protein
MGISSGRLYYYNFRPKWQELNLPCLVRSELVCNLPLHISSYKSPSTVNFCEAETAKNLGKLWDLKMYFNFNLCLLLICKCQRV